MAEQQAHGTGNRSRVTIDMLPDIALLGIFDFYMHEDRVEVWHTLVHVCREWRNIVFGSPRRLNLRLLCTARTPVREKLDVWPLLPVVVHSDGYNLGNGSVDNIISVLEQNDRICQLSLTNLLSFELSCSLSENVLEKLQQPFPILKHLQLQVQCHGRTIPVDPDSFLGGAAPQLQTLQLIHVPVTGLPKLLLSATHLVHLQLFWTYHSGCISPEAMLTCLSMLTRLEELDLGFVSLQSRPDWRSRRPPPLTPILLPVLTKITLQGVSEYLEDLVTGIDAPALNYLTVNFLKPILKTPQLAHFIDRNFDRTSKPMTLDQARVIFDVESDGSCSVTLRPQTFCAGLGLRITCDNRNNDRQVSSLPQVCNIFNSSFPRAFISAVEHLYIFGTNYEVGCTDNGPAQWLELLPLFTAVTSLYIIRHFVPRIAFALQELVGEKVTEVLPALQTLFLEDPVPSGAVQEAIGQFVAARQLAGHPIVVSRWESEVDWWDVYEFD